MRLSHKNEVTTIRKSPIDWHELICEFFSTSCKYKHKKPQIQAYLYRANVFDPHPKTITTTVVINKIHVINGS